MLLLAAPAARADVFDEIIAEQREAELDEANAPPSAVEGESAIDAVIREQRRFERMAEAGRRCGREVVGARTAPLCP